MDAVAKGRSSRRWKARFRSLLRAVCVFVLMLAATPAVADTRHNPKRSGHPLRFLAYVLHPVGYLLDTVLVRPAHWLVSRESTAPAFGHEND